MWKKKNGWRYLVFFNRYFFPLKSPLADWWNGSRIIWDFRWRFTLRISVSLYLHVSALAPLNIFTSLSCSFHLSFCLCLWICISLFLHIYVSAPLSQPLSVSAHIRTWTILSLLFLSVLFFAYESHCTAIFGNSVYIFLSWELRRLSPNFLIHVSVGDLYIPRIDPHISSSRKGRPHRGDI